MQLPLVAKVAAVLVAGTAGSLATSAVVATPAPVVPVPFARAWFDAPLDGTHVPEGSVVAITAHATDRDGVAAVVLAVDGTTVATEDFSGFDDLVTATFEWMPPAPGTYELVVTGQDGSGGKGLPATAMIDAGPGGAATTTTTAASGDTTTTLAGPTTSTAPPSTTAPSGPTTTLSATTTAKPVPATTTTTGPPPPTTACTIHAPTLEAPGDGTTTGRRPTLRWSYGPCDPDLFQVQVSRDPGFARTELDADTSGGERSYTPTVDLPCSTLYWRLRVLVRPTYGEWSTTWSFRVSEGTRTCP